MTIKSNLKIQSVAKAGAHTLLVREQSAPQAGLKIRSAAKAGANTLMVREVGGAEA